MNTPLLGHLSFMRRLCPRKQKAPKTAKLNTKNVINKVKAKPSIILFASNKEKIILKQHGEAT